MTNEKIKCLYIEGKPFDEISKLTGKTIEQIKAIINEDQNKTIDRFTKAIKKGSNRIQFVDKTERLK